MVENWGIMTKSFLFRYSPRIKKIMDDLLIYHPDKYQNTSHLIRCAILRLNNYEVEQMKFYERKRALVQNIIKLLKAVREINIVVLRNRMFELDGSIPSEVDRAIKELIKLDTIEVVSDTIVYKDKFKVKGRRGLEELK